MISRHVTRISIGQLPSKESHYDIEYIQLVYILLKVLICKLGQTNQTQSYVKRAFLPKCHSKALSVDETNKNDVKQHRSLLKFIPSCSR